MIPSIIPVALAFTNANPYTRFFFAANISFFISKRFLVL